MSSNTRNIYDEYIKSLTREEQLRLLEILQTELNNGGENGGQRSILELHGLGKEIWHGVDVNGYVKKLREEWDEPAP